MALSTVKKAFTAKPSYAGDPNCDFLAEACRRATAKNAYHPDENLKALIVNKINETTPGAQVPIKVTYDIIRRRLQMENPHKQWLAVDLTRHLLSASKERLRPYRTELLYHVARVAIKPNKKGPITAQHNARKAATDFLHQCGDEGQDALRMARMQLGNLTTQSMSMAPMGGFGPDGFGAPGMPYSTIPTSQQSGKDNGNAHARIANVQQPTGDVMKDVRNLIDTAESHSSVLNELILASSEEQRESNAPLLAELKQEMLQVKDMFPRLLEQLSMLKTPGSEALMAQALEAHEQIDQCLDMERQYAEGLQAEAELAKDREAGHLRDDDDDEEEDVEEDDEGADGAKEGKGEGDEGEANKSPSAAAVSPQAPTPPAAPAFDLLNFDSGPLPAAGASGNATGKAGEPQSEDLFGLGALQTNLPSPGGAPGAQGAPAAAPSAAGATPANDDPFMSNEPLGDQSNAAASTPSQQPSSNPFATQPQGAAPVAGPGVTDTTSNPFGSNAFGQPSPGASVPTGSPVGHGAPQGQGFQGNPVQQHSQQQGGSFVYTGAPPGQGQPMQFPPGAGQTGPYGGSSIPPGQFGGPPGQGIPGQGMPGQGMPGQGMPGQGMPGQFMGGHTGPQGMPPQQPGFQMYGQPQGWGAPGQAPPGHPFGNSAFPGPQGGAQQQFPPGQGFHGPPHGQFGGMQGAPHQQFAQTAPIQGFGGAPAANPFAPQQPVPMQQVPGQFAGGATGFPPQQANPFAATSTGFVPPWNPHGHKDAFGDLIHEHNKRTNSTPPMTAPMRPHGGGANGLL